MIVTFFIGNCTHVLNVYMASFGGDLLKSLNIRLLFGKRLFGWRRQVVWGFRGLSCLTKLCLGSGYGALGMKSPIYGVTLLPPNMGKLEGVGALELLEGRMVVGCGRILGKV